jgi:tRNA(Ile)-lysidine synthase
MVLTSMLSRWAQSEGCPTIHALTVDHGLRAESATEAEQVGQWVKDWPHVTHHILRWESDKPDARIMEEARRARYDLMRDYCRKNGIRHLFVAHHQDDQAETFLIRLAGGSGLDGLAGMRSVQELGPDFSLVRPFLGFSKERLIATCATHSIPYVDDPSNQKTDYLRPRLRASRAILEGEGLSSKRLFVTATRLSRARDALEQLTEKAFTECVTEQNGEGTGFDFAKFKAQPAEIRLRLILRAMDYLRPDKDYAPRMEKAEDLLEALSADDFRGRTLGGCSFAIRGGGKALWVGKE